MILPYTPTILMADAYKITMGLAGNPLATETFYLSFRRGGHYYIPFNLRDWMINIINHASHILTEQEAFLRDEFHALSGAMRSAMQSICGSYEIMCPPKGSWVLAKEPIITFKGPSFLASWLETQLIWLQYPIQLATQLKQGTRQITVVTEGQEKIAQTVIEEMGLVGQVEIQHDENYTKEVSSVLRGMIDACGDPTRLLEGGMRSAVSYDHHKLVLEECKRQGVVKTSNMQAAYELGMTPAGTAGHEHTERVGSDFLAYRNSVERVPGLAGCLLDTWSTINSGIPAAIRVAKLYPHRQFVSREDSGNKEAYFLLYTDLLRRNKIENQIINIAGDVNERTIRKFEQLCEMDGWPSERLSYMIGGQLTCETLDEVFNRNTASAAYKLSRSAGRAVMKFGDSADGGKNSIPGDPVTWRKILDRVGPTGIIAQADEPVPEGYRRLDQPETWQIGDSGFMRDSFLDGRTSGTAFSPQTKALIKQLRREGNV